MIDNIINEWCWFDIKWLKCTFILKILFNLLFHTYKFRCRSFSYIATFTNKCTIIVSQIYIIIINDYSTYLFADWWFFLFFFRYYNLRIIITIIFIILSIIFIILSIIVIILSIIILHTFIIFRFTIIINDFSTLNIFIYSFDISINYIWWYYFMMCRYLFIRIEW